MIPKESAIAATETVKNTVSAASILSHIRNNRVEYLAMAILAHLLGVSDRILAQASGVCF